MILIADSGSTKCDWVLTNPQFEPIREFSTIGLNPYFHGPEFTANALRDNQELMEVAPVVTHVFFYGAGSSTPKLCTIMRDGLQQIFQQARIHVDHDLVGAAYSTYTGEPAVTCILGTGSNSCFFDGELVSEEIPSLAFIVGDECSGSYFGKRLLRAYFYKRMPEDLRVHFERDYAPTKDEFVDRVYNQSHANVYLASFMKFLGDHHDHAWVQEMVANGMRAFLDIHVKCFSNWQEVPAHFVGSVGHFFNDTLTRVCAEMGIRLGRVIRKPIEGLVEYHRIYKQSEVQA